MVGVEEDWMRALVGMALILSSSLTASSQEDPDGRILELFDITDLLAYKVNLPGVDVSLARDSVGTSAAAMNIARPTAVFVPALRALLSPRSSVELKEGILVVRAMEDELRSVRDLLAVYRRRLDQLVTVEAQILTSSADLRGDQGALLLSRHPLEEAVGIRRKAGTDKGSVLHAPKLTLLNGQQGRFSAGELTEYVREFQLKIDSSGKLRATPLKDVALSGLTLEFKPVVKDAEKKEILLDEVTITLTAPRQKTFRTITTPYGAVEDPEIQKFSVSLHPTVKEDEVLLAGPFSKPWSGKDDPKVWILIQGKLLNTAELETPRKK